MPLMPRPLAAFVLTLASGPALADVTAQNVWDNWNAYIDGLGYQVDAKIDQTANGLTAQNLTVSVDFEENTGRAVMDIGNVQFLENSDGTVDIVFAKTVPIKVDMTPPSGEAIAFKIDYSQDTLAMRASGTPEMMRYDYTAREMKVSLGDLVVDGTAMPASAIHMAIGLEGIEGTTTTSLSTSRDNVQAFTAARVNYDMVFTDPENPESVQITGNTQDLTFAGTSQTPIAIAGEANFGALLRAGLGFDGSFSFGPSSTQMTSTSADGPFSGTSQSSGGALAVALSPDGISYLAEQNGLSVNMIAAASPFPITFDVAKSAVNFAAPLQQSDAPSNFALGFELSGFSMSDMLWAMFDPAAQLPRDPATLAIDLSGKIRLLADLMDPANFGDGADSTPAEFEQLDINKLKLSVAGADLSGSGAFSFDNTKSLAGMPKPTGNLALKLVGANGLIDTLVAMGLLPEEQAMGARMMMALFAVPEEGTDTLTSKIEINNEGHILANGQRIQ